MKTIKIPIIPIRKTIAKVEGKHELDLEAICLFIAFGFFFDTDTYWKDEVCLLPAHNHALDSNKFLIKSEPWFHWHYSPKEISFESALEEYTQLLTTIITEQVGDNPVILPLSGGLDSRSQALILKGLDNPVHTYSYSFPGGYPEHKISEQIAKVCNFSFEAFKIPKGYLWDSIGR